jgi:uncharacterized protein (DUF849 family)
MTTKPRIYLKACINGTRTSKAHPSFPVTPEQLAAVAVAVHQAGVDDEIVHDDDRFDHHHS